MNEIKKVFIFFKLGKKFSLNHDRRAKRLISYQFVRIVATFTIHGTGHSRIYNNRLTRMIALVGIQFVIVFPIYTCPQS